MPYRQGRSHAQIAKLLGKSNAYPNIGTAAEFRPNSLTIHFHQLTRDMLVKDNEGALINAGRKNVEVIMHELTHWADQVSSVWGQEYIVNLYDAFWGAEYGTEYHFSKVIDLFDEQRRILLPSYYHIISPNPRPHSTTTRWTIDFSAGQEFDPKGNVDATRPIYFVIFGDNANRERIARQPITVGTLLETTATWAELRAGLDVLSTMPELERRVEARLWTGEKSSFLYNPNFTTYTAPVHLLSHAMGTTNILVAYERGAALACIALNLTGELFDKLLHPDSFGLFGSRREAFVHARNRGYAFAVLAQHSVGLDADSPVQSWIETILSKAGLPSFDEIMSNAMEHIKALSKSLTIRCEYDERRDYLLKIGRYRLFATASKRFSRSHFEPLALDVGPLPPMFDKDGQLFSIGPVLDPSQFDAETMHDDEWRLREFTDRLLQGCRGLESPC